MELFTQLFGDLRTCIGRCAPVMDLEDAFAWKEERTLSQALTLQYDKDISFDPKIYLVNDLMSTIAKPSVTFSDRLQPLAVSEMPLAVRCSIGPRRGCARTCCCGSIGVSRRVSVEEKTVIPFRSATSALNPWICWTPESLGGVDELVDVARMA